MKKIHLFVVIFIFGLHGFAQTREQRLIQAPLIRFFDVMAATQLDALKAEVTADFSLLENGKIWTMDSLALSMERYKGLDLKRVNHLDFVKTETLGKLALVSYYNTADLTFRGKSLTVKWLESAVLIEEKGKWKIRMLHSTELKAPPEEAKKN